MKVNNVTVNYNIRELTICMGLIRAYVTLKILLDLLLAGFYFRNISDSEESKELKW